jgi:hypothetical protein
VDPTDDPDYEEDDLDPPPPPDFEVEERSAERNRIDPAALPWVIAQIARRPDRIPPHRNVRGD